MTWGDVPDDADRYDMDPRDTAEDEHQDMSDITITDNQIAAAMTNLGGSFCQALGRAYQLADDVNQAKIRTAFAEEWETYRELVRLRAKAKR